MYLRQTHALSVLVSKKMSSSVPPRAQFWLLVLFALASYSSAMAKEKREVKVFKTEDKLAESLANFTARLSRKSIHQRGKFTVVLSGGTLFNHLRKLKEEPYIGKVDWAKWHVFWVDERAVEKTDIESNYKLANDNFLSKVPIPEGQIYPMINNKVDVAGAAKDYESKLKELVKSGVVELSPHTEFPRFDLILLVMETDGKIASFFPHHQLLEEKKRWVSYITDSPKPPASRVTLTLPVIDASAHLFMVATGSNSADSVKNALQGGSSTDTMPVQMVKLEKGEFIWFLDNTAASKLHSPKLD